MLMRHLGVVRDTAVAMNRNAYCKRHQLLGFCIQRMCSRSSAGEGAERLHRIGCSLAYEPNSVHDIIGNLFEILLHGDLLSLLNLLRISAVDVQRNYVRALHELSCSCVTPRALYALYYYSPLAHSSQSCHGRSGRPRLVSNDFWTTRESLSGSSISSFCKR